MAREQKLFREDTKKDPLTGVTQVSEVGEEKTPEYLEEEKVTGTLPKNVFRASTGLDEVTDDERKEVLEDYQKEQKEKLDTETTPTETTDTATQDLMDTTKAIISEGDKAIEAEKELKEKLEEGATDSREETIRIAEEEAKKREDLLKKREEDLLKQEEASLKELEDLKTSQVSELELEKKLALSKTEAQRKQAALRAERAVREERVRQKASEIEFKMYLNRSGLANTGASAYQAVQLANEGARAIAELQENAALTQTEFVNQASELELNYTKAINEVTTEYNQNKNKIDREFDEAIFKIQDRRFTNSIDKQKAIQQAKDDYLDNIRNIQSSFVSNVSNIRKTQQANQSALVEQFEVFKTAGLTKLNQGIIDGTYFNLSDAEQVELANQVGLSLPDLEARVRTEINGAIRGLYDATLGANYSIGATQMNGMMMEVVNLMTNSSYSLERALNEIVLPSIQDTDEYKSAIEASATENLLDIEEREAEIDLLRARAGKERASALSSLSSGNSKSSVDQEVEAIIQNLSVGGRVPDTTIVNVLEKLPVDKQIAANNRIEEARVKGEKKVKSEELNFGEAERTKLEDLLTSEELDAEGLEQLKSVFNNTNYFLALTPEEFKEELETFNIPIGDDGLSEGELYYDEDSGKIRAVIDYGFDEDITNKIR